MEVVPLSKNVLLGLPSDPGRFASWLLGAAQAYVDRRVILNFEGVHWARDVADIAEVCRHSNLAVQGVCGVVEHEVRGVLVLQKDRVLRPWLSFPDADPLVIQNRVRTGQKFENLSGDIDVLDSVSSGGEVEAGGSVRIAGTLRGNVVAGTRVSDAVVICGELQAELISIAGTYVTGAKITPAYFGSPVSISVVDGKMVFKRLERKDVLLPVEEIVCA
jgi:septum site-determining protein MinC